jgi:hypothetical protein
MKTSATNRKLRILLTGIKSNTLIPKPEFQRRLVWTNDDKLNFLQTVLEGYPFPEVYIAAGVVNPDTGEGTEMLVDGQQRMTTLYQYFMGSDEIKLKSPIKPYRDLNESEKINFLEYEVVIRDLGNKTIEEIKEIFKRINSTKYSLNAMEIHNARFDGAFKKFAENISQKEFFEEHRVFTATDVKRMNDIVFCLSVIITVLSTYFNRDDEFENFLSKYNDEFEYEDDLNSEINGVISAIEKLDFSTNSRVWKKADLFTLMVELHRALFKQKIPINARELFEKLKAFYDLVDNRDFQEIDIVNSYRKATASGTNDRSSRILRGEVIYDIISGKLSFD